MWFGGQIMILSVTLVVLVTVIFAALGTAKILALAPMRELAARVGLSTTAYRGSGALEVGGAVGVALGPVVPLFGGLAGTGLLLLLAGAPVTHLGDGDGPREIAPAVVSALLVGAYLAVLFGATP
jgi:hypothetical protein